MIEGVIAGMQSNLEGRLFQRRDKPGRGDVKMGDVLHDGRVEVVQLLLGNAVDGGDTCPSRSVFVFAVNSQEFTAKGGVAADHWCRRESPGLQL